jgi:hypothetical protein
MPVAACGACAVQVDQAVRTDLQVYPTPCPLLRCSARRMSAAPYQVRACNLCRVKPDFDPRCQPNSTSRRRYAAPVAQPS